MYKNNNRLNPLVLHKIVKNESGINYEDVNISISLTINDEFQLPGDVNGDGELNIQDVIIIITEFILNDLYNSIADLNEDGDLNIQDVIILINIILN